LNYIARFLTVGLCIVSACSSEDSKKSNDGGGENTGSGGVTSAPNDSMTSGSGGASANGSGGHQAIGTGGSGQGGTSGGSGGAMGAAGGGPDVTNVGVVPMVTAKDTVGDFTYQEVAGAVCRDGSPAGYYLKKGKSKNLMIFLNGGGVCFDDFFCGINPANVDQSLPGETLFGATLDQISSSLMSVRQTPPEEGIFQSDPTNPVSDWTQVFVPYCTGDVYAGTTHDAPVTTSTMGLPPQQFVGYTNLGLFYQTLAADFGGSEKVLLTGSSAGGFGTLLNFDRTADFFKNSKVYALTDSGIPFRDQFMEPCMQKEWRELWGLDKILPKDCKGCFNADGGGLAQGLGDYIFKQKYKGRMLGGGLSSTQDQVIKLFFSAGLENCTTDTASEAIAAFTGLGSYPEDRYPAGLKDFVENVAGDSVGYYAISEDGINDLHQHLFRQRFYEDNGVGKTIAAWLGDLLNDQPERLGSFDGAGAPAVDGGTPSGDAGLFGP
jgi:hypothetical protein